MLVIVENILDLNASLVHYYIQKFCSLQDIKVMETKKKEGEKLQGMFDKMRAQDQADNDALAAAEKRLQAISSGMYSTGDGEDATLQEQLISESYVF